jgi:hypothetical protein
VLRIRDVYPGSDPTFFHPGSEFFSIPDPDSASKNLSILTLKKWFLSSKKYDPGCSPRIRIPDPDFLLIPDPRSRGQKCTGSRIRIRNTERNKRSICHGDTTPCFQFLSLKMTPPSPNHPCQLLTAKSLPAIQRKKGGDHSKISKFPRFQRQQAKYCFLYLFLCSRIWNILPKKS